MWGQDRTSLRQTFVRAWQQREQGLPQDPQHLMIADVVALHPEYQGLLADTTDHLERDFDGGDGSENPFLHMAMHIAIREQLAIDRPPGIRAIHRRLGKRLGEHPAEHRMMECLGQTLWDAQRVGQEPDMAAYVERLQSLR